MKAATSAAHVEQEGDDRHEHPEMAEALQDQEKGTAKPEIHDLRSVLERRPVKAVLVRFSGVRVLQPRPFAVILHVPGDTVLISRAWHDPVLWVEGIAVLPAGKGCALLQSLSLLATRRVPCGPRGDLRDVSAPGECRVLRLTRRVAYL